MSDKLYTTSTAALKATSADIRILDAKKIKLKGKNILDYIKESEFTNYDTRDPQLKNDEVDIWNTEISLSEEGHIEVKPLEHTYYEMTDGQEELLLNSAVKVIDNEVLDANGNHLMYWQTDGLTDCMLMFTGGSITTFDSDLSSLINGSYMFNGNQLIKTFRGDLSSLVNGEAMFDSSFLESFESNLSSLDYGYQMFCNSELTSFNCNMSKLTKGVAMFLDCSNLTTFTSDLSSLTNGNGMFDGCKLDAQSVANIIHTIKDMNNVDPLEPMPNITIGIGCNNTAEDQLLFAQECDCDTWQELLDDFSAKNWTVTFQCNGRPTTTYNMRRGEILPIYAKLEEVTMHADEKERKPYYTYTSADGSKFYNINYFHSTNGSTDGYDVFSSLEEAVETYNVIHKN